MHKNLRKTDDRLLELKEKLEKEGDRSDLEEEIIQLRSRVAELEESEQKANVIDDAEYRRQIENEIKAIEDLENELDRLRKTALIHKQLERFVEDSMFKMEELNARYEFEEKKTCDMESGIAQIKVCISEMDTVSPIATTIPLSLIINFRPRQM